MSFCKGEGSSGSGPRAGGLFYPRAHSTFILGDKVVKEGAQGPLEFGEVLNSDDGHLYIVWDTGTPTKLDDIELNSLSKIGVYDRPLAVGTRVRHLGKEGRVFSTNRIITAYLTGHEKIVIFPDLKEARLYPPLDCKVGDTVMKDGWIGEVTQGEVSIKYLYDSGMTLEVKQDLESVQHVDYPQKKLIKLPNNFIQIGTWSSGMGWLNRIKYRNKPLKISKMELTCLSVFWFDRLKTTEDNATEPSNEIRHKKDLSKVFSFENPSIDKYHTDAVFTLRWDDHLYENYENWRETIVSKYIRREPVLEENSQPFFKRSRGEFPFTNRDRVTVKVLFCQTEVEILFDDGSSLTIMSENIGEILGNPFSIERELPFPDKKYLLGDVVKDKMEFLHPHKYGFVLSQNYERRTLQVKWVTLLRNKSVSSETKEMSQYDIQLFYKYQLLKNQPQIVIAKGIFECVIKGLNLSEGKVKVQCAEGPVKEFWAHELEFCTKKVFISPVDKSKSVRYVPLTQDVSPSPMYCTKNAGSALLHIHPLRPKLVVNVDLPWDHSFFNKLPPKGKVPLSLHFEERLNRDILKGVELLTSSPLGSSVWIERFADRKDLLTVVLLGRNDTIYKSVPFFLDFAIPLEYPRGELPEVVFRLPRIYDPNWIHPSIDINGRLTFEGVDLGGEEAGDEGSLLFNILNYIQRKVLCKEPYLESQGLAGLLPEGEDVNNENNNGNDNGGLDEEILVELKKSRDFNETGIIVLAEHIHSLLCQPPSTWKEFVETHFRIHLSKICWRFMQYLENVEEFPDDNLLKIKERGESPFLLYPTSDSFKLALKSRLDNLNPFLEA